jgi:DNA anti-recombination protein RmuC
MTISEIEKKIKTLNQSLSTALAKKEILETNKQKYANEFTALTKECKDKFNCEPKQLADKITKLGSTLEEKITAAEETLSEIIESENQ